MKRAVILFNLGGPDSLESVKPFLLNLFSDRAIISLPQPFRYLLANLISHRRNNKAMQIYKKIGGKSPICSETEEQAKALEVALCKHGEYRVFFCMRYWHPMAAEVAERVKKYDPAEIILLPLYPQFSSTTTASSFKNWFDNTNKVPLDKPTKKICCYYNDTLFCKSYAELIKPLYNEANKFGNPKLLFSAHGIPLNRIKKGDPYEWQTNQTVINIVKELNINPIDYTVCYQSKVGPLRWLEPSTEEEIIKASKEGKPIVVAPITFVSEHSETLVELDIEYKMLAEQNGCKHYFRVPTVRTNSLFIEALKNLCLNGAPSQCSGSIVSCKPFSTI
jgi:protoporphyrin/coproporphyrin ferrochelatase